jgi:hypothetical protein
MIGALELPRTYAIALAEPDLKVIADALGELKHRVAAPVLSRIMQQVLAQQAQEPMPVGTTPPDVLARSS